VWDDQAVSQKPHWARITHEGKRDSHKISFWSHYADSLLIPQLKEISDYGIDGVWVDGDCWAVEPDYHAKAQEAFRLSTGIEKIPTQKNDPNYSIWLDFHREAFRNYVKKYTDALHAYNPKFQVASNWAFSSFMPEPVDIPIDFTSGDITPMNGVHSALFEARVLATQSRVYQKPWDLMSWSFNTTYNTSNHALKTPLHLNQEAAEIMAVGGGYQCYFTQNRDASIKVQQVKTMAEIAKFARARQPYCQGSEGIPQIGLLYSLAHFKKNNQGVYNNSLTEPLRGALVALMDGQQVVEIVAEHHLKDDLARYPLIVIPEWTYLEKAFVGKLKKYVLEGGNLLVIGTTTTGLFKDELGFEPIGSPQKERFWVNVEQDLGLVNDSLQQIKLWDTSNLLGQIYRQDDIRFPAMPAASVRSVGKGKIAGIYFNFGRSYLQFQSPQLRDFLGNIVGRLLPDPLVKVEGSRLVHVTLQKLKEKTTVHLINAGGFHKSNEVSTYDQLPPLYDLTVTLHTPKKPQKITLQPENIPLKFRYVAGKSTVTVPKLEIHAILVAE
ncbi:MAG: beta-galactosidase trimerization domain-containing protein, partial [Runella sp.]